MPLTELEAHLRPIARGRIEEGVLPCEGPHKMWGGKGSGTPCSLCDQPIAPNEVEYEVELSRAAIRRLKFHIVCESIWQLECARKHYLSKHASPE